jgi:hypothetical protein
VQSDFGRSRTEFIHVASRSAAETAGSHGLNREHPWALASLSLCMLLSSLGTSIANVGLPTLAQAFGALVPAGAVGGARLSAGHHQLIVSAGRLGDCSAADACC